MTFHVNKPLTGWAGFDDSCSLIGLPDDMRLVRFCQTEKSKHWTLLV